MSNFQELKLNEMNLNTLASLNGNNKRGRFHSFPFL